MALKCGLIIPTLNAGKNFKRLLEEISRQDLNCKKLVVDSESTDGTPELAESFGFEVLKIQREKFNHGKTRQFAVEYLQKKFSIDIAVFLTQDVFLYGDKTLSKLVEIFAENSEVGLTFGRQLPHKNATLEAKFLREFNYPAKSQLRSLADKKFLGLKVATASNSFAAYRVNFLQEVGGFPTQVILCEDMFVAAKMLLARHKIFYNAETQVFHSHNYKILQEFSRYFDIGVFHSRESWIRKDFGSAESAGKKFVLLKLKNLWQNNSAEIFSAICHDFAKFLGYRLGRLEKFLPEFVCKLCAMNKNFFNKKDSEN